MRLALRANGNVSPERLAVLAFCVNGFSSWVLHVRFLDRCIMIRLGLAL